MERLEKALKDLKGVIDTFRGEVDALAGEISTVKRGLSPEKLQAELCELQERIRQAAMEKYVEVLEEASVVESELQAKLQQVQAFKDQAHETSNILIALTGAQDTVAGRGAHGG
ncbi:MAG: hypothetical protein ACE5I9_12405 [Candidatus Methylomirabilales bacterium]